MIWKYVNLTYSKISLPDLYLLGYLILFLLWEGFVVVVRMHARQYSLHYRKYSLHNEIQINIANSIKFISPKFYSLWSIGRLSYLSKMFEKTPVVWLFWLNFKTRYLCSGLRVFKKTHFPSWTILNAWTTCGDVTWK